GGGGGQVPMREPRDLSRDAGGGGGVLGIRGAAAASGGPRWAPAPNPPHSKRPGFRLGRWDPIPPMWLEGRIYLEFLRLIRDPVFRGLEIPPGLRRPVLLVPGFLAGGWTLRTQFDWLKRIGYRPLLAGLAFNVRYSEVVLKTLLDSLAEMNRKTGARVSVVGHSRG